MFSFNSYRSVAKAKRGIHRDNYMCNGYTHEKKESTNFEITRMELTPYSPTEYSLVKADNNAQRLPPIRSGDIVSK